jgi:hypothetical protein
MKRAATQMEEIIRADLYRYEGLTKISQGKKYRALPAADIDMRLLLEEVPNFLDKRN